MRRVTRNQYKILQPKSR